MWTGGRLAGLREEQPGDAGEEGEGAGRAPEETTG